MTGEDVVAHMVHTTAHAYLLFFTNRGGSTASRHTPSPARAGRPGVLAQSVLPLEPEERIEAIIDTRDYETSRFLVMVTRKGMGKKTPFREYESRNATLVAINLQDGDELVDIHTTNGENDLLVFTRDGMGIRFSEGDLRPMGRATQGVRAIRLRPDDEVVAATSDDKGDEVLLLTTAGYGKRTRMDQFRRQTRGGYRGEGDQADQAPRPAHRRQGRGTRRRGRGGFLGWCGDEDGGGPDKSPEQGRHRGEGHGHARRQQSGGGDPGRPRGGRVSLGTRAGHRFVVPRSEAASSGSRTAPGRLGRSRGGHSIPMTSSARRVRRIIRKIDPWTVLKVSFVFQAVVALAIVLGAVILWSVVVARGIPQEIDGLLQQLRS